MADFTTPGAATKASDLDSQHLRYMRSSDGKLIPLALQSFGDPNILPETSRWSRLGKTFSPVPSIVHVSHWIGASLLVPGTAERVYTPKSIGVALIKLIFAWPLLCILVTGIEFLSVIGEANYDTVQCSKDHGKGIQPSIHISSVPGSDDQDAPSSQEGAETASEQGYLDNIRLSSDLPRPPSSQSQVISEGPSARSRNPVPTTLRPRYLCFIQDADKGTYETVKVNDYLKRHGDHVDIEFVFISYTRVQFRVATEEEIERYDYPNEETRAANKEVARRDRETLVRWGIDAARQAGKKAFWLDFECVRNDDGIARSTSSSDDVYRICDVVRAAHSMIIAIGPPVDDKVDAILSQKEPPTYSPESVTPWLRQWGSRLWTLPELLLCPREYRIKLYVLGDPAQPMALAKRNFAERAWDDAEAVKELVNHYEGAALLTQLNLIEIALACFSRRKTDQFSQGDIAYAIMGLLPHRQRPSVDQADSGFQAFARLSLANDGEFIERLICLLPPGSDAPWYDTRDHWRANPSDIHPTTQVSDILDADTLLLDGVHGAMIQWDRLEPQHPALQNSIFEVIVMQMFIMCTTLPKIFALIYLIFGLLDEIETSQGLYVLFIPGLALIAVCAFMVPILFICARPTNQKPERARLIGIEGFWDAGEVEKKLWGVNHGSLDLVPAPQHYRDTDGVVKPVAQEGCAFTLVDTCMMTVTHFRCKLPPVAMLVCGHEAGMQRALLCSYDWKRNTFCRQTVLRVETRVLDQMKRTGSIRFSLTSEPSSKPVRKDTGPEPSPDSTLGQGPVLDASASSSEVTDEGHTWKVELLFSCVVFLALRVDASFSYLRTSYYYGPTLYNLFYNLSFLAAQVLSLFLLTRLPINRIFPWVVMMKGWAQIIPYWYLYHDDSRLQTLACLSGVVDGLLMSIFIVLTWSWFPSEKVPFRLILWAVIGPAVLTFLLSDMFYEFAEILYIIVVSIHVSLCFLFSIIGSYVGRPEEVPWLDGHQKVFYTRQAAAQKFEIKVISATWQQRKALFIQCLGPILVFCISIMSAINCWPALRFEIDGKEELSSLLATSTVGLVLLCIPRASIFITLLCHPLAFFGFLIKRIDDLPGILGLIAYFLTTLSFVVLPLIWAMIVNISQTWTEALLTLSVSFIGRAVGIIIVSNVNLEEGTVGFVACALMNVALVLFIRIYWYLGDRKRWKARETEIEPTYSDNSEERGESQGPDETLL